MKRTWAKARMLEVVVLIVVVVLVVACTPKATPAPTPSAPRAEVPSPTPVAITTPTSEEATWAKVVAAAKQEGVLNIYAGADFSGDKGKTVMGAFRDKYGIRVEMASMPGRQTEEKVKIENAMRTPIADIADAGLTNLGELSRLGLLASVWQELPELRDKSVFLADPVYSPSGDVLIFSIGVSGTLVNTKLVKAQDEPRSYVDLLDPKWKGKMIFLDPRLGSGAGFNWFSMTLYYKALDEDYFRRLAGQEIRFWGASDIEMHNMIGRGEAEITPAAATSSVAYMIQEGAPLKLLGMKEGNHLSADSIAMVKGAVHPNAAKLFLNWILSKEGSTVYNRAANLESIRKDVPNFLDSRARLQPPAQKLLPRTYEQGEATRKYHTEGLAERIFGKK